MLRPIHIKNKELLLLLCLLFFMWGVAMNLMNSLNTSISYYLSLDGTQAACMQLVYYFAYLVAAIPAALITHRFGFKGGILSALTIFAAGCIVTFPAANIAKGDSALGFLFFLLALFVMSFGSATLEANCSPYVTRMGSAKKETTRINLANAFNGLGSIFGPILLSFFVSAVAADPYQATTSKGMFLEDKIQFLGSLKLIYGGIACTLILLAIIFVCIKLPSLPCEAEDKEPEKRASFLAPFKHRTYRLGLLALFLYCGIQLSGMTFIGLFAHEEVDMSLGTATFLVGMSSLALTTGRFVGVPLLKKYGEYKLLKAFMLIASVLFTTACVSSLLGCGLFGLVSYISAFFFCSIGYATLYSLTLRGLRKSELKVGGALLIICMIGGGVFTVALSFLASITNYACILLAYVPALFYIMWYAIKHELAKN